MKHFLLNSLLQKTSFNRGRPGGTKALSFGDSRTSSSGRIPAWSCHLLAGSIPRKSVPTGRNWGESVAPSWGSYLQWDTVHTFAQGAVATPGQRERELGLNLISPGNGRGKWRNQLVKVSLELSLVWEIYTSSEHFSTPHVAGWF